MKVVSNAGPLIHLSWIGQLDLLQQLYNEFIVPARVREEVLQADEDVPGVSELRSAFATGWIHVHLVESRKDVEALESFLDAGESEAIVLAREAQADIVLLDDRRARREAERQGFPISGTVGILQSARDRALIPAVLPLLIELRSLGFRSSEALLEQIRREETAG
jgi:predicted nucleic acid-binding protein